MGVRVGTLEEISLKSLRPLVIAVPLLNTAPAFAEELPPVVVTAARTAQTVDETLYSVTVITREDIERRQVQSLVDLLRSVPGVTITNNGGLGKVTSIFLRGTESDHVLVLIDGIKIGSATLGSTAFEDIPIAQIERIEVVRGSNSALYGSEAIGGVIQIFTRKGGGALTPAFNISGGSYKTSQAAAGISGGGKNSWFNINAAHLDSEGFNACDGCSAFVPYEPDDDGYRNSSVALRAGYRFTGGTEIDAQLLRADSKNEYDSNSQNQADKLQQASRLSLRFSPLEFWQLKLTAGSSRDESENYSKDRVVLPSRFDTQRDSISLQNDIALGDEDLFTIGIDYQDDQVSSTVDYEVRSRDNKGLFMQYLGGFATHDWQLSARRDNNQQFGTQNTGRLAWGYALNQALRLTVAYGTAFKAPTFNDLYFPGFSAPLLAPEESDSVEFGLSGRSDWVNWSLNAYQIDIDNLIAYDASISKAANIDKARIHGLETVLSTTLGNWGLNANLTMLDPGNRAQSYRGNLLARRAKRVLQLDVDRSFGSYQLGAGVHATSKRYDDLDNTNKLAGYATLDLRAEYALAKHWLAQARIENVLDKDYQTASGYNQPGRSLYFSLRYQP